MGLMQQLVASVSGLQSCVNCWN